MASEFTSSAGTANEEYYSEEVFGEDKTTETNIEDNDLDDKYPLMDDYEEDEEQKLMYQEYLQLIKEIEGQNYNLLDLKKRILELCNNPCKTACDEKEIRDCRALMEYANLELKCLINKATQLQNNGSHRLWEDIPITTTFDEDNVRPYITCTSPNKYEKAGSSPCENTSTDSSTQALPCDCKKRKSAKNAGMEADSEEEHVRQILRGLKKLKITCPEDKHTLCEVMQALSQKSSKPCPPCPPPCPQPCYKPSSSKKNKSKPCDSDVILEHLADKICGMQEAVNKIKCEIAKRQRMPRKPQNAICTFENNRDAVLECGGNMNAKAAQIEKLKENYCYLLAEYARKEAELKDCKAKSNNWSGPTQNDAAKQGVEETELCLMRARITELKEEQQEFKCIMKEQATQLEDYRNKYISAQQKVEEQCVLLEKLNMNNKRIEKQINCEVKEIRDKFQEKLTELLHFPKLLENEHLKVAELTKNKEEIEQKLVLVCKELSLARERNSPKETQDLGPKLAKCQAECEELQKRVCDLQQQRDLYCEELRRTKDDLDTLRCESAKIIARTKERTELIRQQQQECINKLEKELAQCRATACLSVSDREAVIREMQGQLNTLAFSFDSAQKQIKTLRNHIAYVSNENCYPVKCQ